MAVHGPHLVDDGEQERGSEAEEQPSVQRFKCSHELPAGLENEIRVAVTRDRTQRIKYCRAVVGKSIEMSIRDRPEDGLQSVEAGGEQGRGAHNRDEDASGMRLAHKPVENLVGGLVDQPQTEDVDDHGQNDQW